MGVCSCVLFVSMFSCVAIVSTSDDSGIIFGIDSDSNAELISDEIEDFTKDKHKGQLCKDEYGAQHCARWKGYNVCKSSPAMMRTMCAKTCGFCPKTSDVCQDRQLTRKCSLWKLHGSCNTHPEKMARFCAQTCDMCDAETKCKQIKCPHPQQCTLDKHRNAVCACVRRCKRRKHKRKLGLVCGTDYKEYDDRCELEHSMCQKKRTVYVEDYGFCKAFSPPIPCSDVYSTERCLKWKQVEACTLYRDVMKSACRKTCELCEPIKEEACISSQFGCCWDKKTPSHGITGYGCPECKDLFRFCHYFIRDCNSAISQNKHFMRDKCAQTCGYC